ncbi:MAG: methyl-accepting chemotaxis protein, partial [Candidatus Thorarchaeota archaeon]
AIDKEFNVTYMNPTGANVVGKTVDQVLGMKCYDLFKTPHCRTQDCALGQAMSQDRVTSAETVARPMKDKEIPIMYNGAPIKDASGNIIGALEYVVDITETKKAMTDAQQKVDNLNSIPTPIMAIDKEFNVTYMNPTGANVVGKTVDQVIGMKCYDLFKTPHCRSPDCALDQAMNQNKTTTAETIARPLKDKEIPIMYTGAPIKDYKDNIIGALEYVVDITDIKELMEEQQNAKEYLENQVNKLLDVVGAASEGNLSVQAEKERDDEVGKLIEGINKMIENLKNLMQEQQDAKDYLDDQVNKLLDIVSKAAEGDLTVKGVKEKDDTIGELVDGTNSMINNLQGLVREIQYVASTVASTSQELASSAEEMNASTQQVSSAIQQISKGSQTQATQVEETVNIMKEMSDSVKEVASRSKSSAEKANKMNENAQTGRKAVTDTVAKMQEIQKVVTESASTIEGLGKRSEEISQIVDVITNITDQTNLLALNAAIEAARAGEHGRGFAVVAEEVKNLAEDSKEAAERIAKMIKEIQDNTNKAVDTMRHGTKEVEEGIQVVNSTDNTFEEIAGIATVTNDDVQGISVAAEQQLLGSEKIAKAIDSIASIAEESASASEESASSTEELTASMEDMTARAQELSETAIALQKKASRFTIEGELNEENINENRTNEKSIKKRKKVEVIKKEKKKEKSPVLSKKVKESLKKRGIDVDEEESDVSEK